MKKIVFLTPSGVLNTSASHRSSRNQGVFEDEPLTALFMILERTGAQIVITGSWRRKMPLEKLQEIFHAYGILGNVLIGYTPDLGMDDPRKREQEILGWLAKNNPGEVKIVILDHASGVQILGDRLIQVDPKIGLTRIDARRAMALLNE